MPKSKPQGWLDDLKALVKEGKNYKDVQDSLKEKYGQDEGAVGVSTYGKLKKLAFPEGKVADVIDNVQEGRREAKGKGKKPQWTPQKQSAGDKSQLAGVLNEVIFFVIPCQSGKLELKHVQEINVGGGIVNTIQYAFPDIDLNNPILVLGLRVGLLIVKVKKMCKDVKGALKTGLKPNFLRHEAEVPEPVTINLGEHPTDKYFSEHGLFEEQQPKEGEKTK